MYWNIKIFNTNKAYAGKCNSHLQLAMKIAGRHLLTLSRCVYYDPHCVSGILVSATDVQ